MSHINNGRCSKCEEIFNRFPGFDQGLKTWFYKVQKEVPRFHIAEAGRGRVEQEKDFGRGASKAHYGQSAHNANAAIDTFFLDNENQYSLDERFYELIKVYIDDTIEWYGAKGAKFYERPHFQVADFEERKKSGRLNLVE